MLTTSFARPAFTSSPRGSKGEGAGLSALEVRYDTPGRHGDGEAIPLVVLSSQSREQRIKFLRVIVCPPINKRGLCCPTTPVVRTRREPGPAAAMASGSTCCARIGKNDRVARPEEFVRPKRMIPWSWQVRVAKAWVGDAWSGLRQATRFE